MRCVLHRASPSHYQSTRGFRKQVFHLLFLKLCQMPFCMAKQCRLKCHHCPAVLTLLALPPPFPGTAPTLSPFPTLTLFVTFKDPLSSLGCFQRIQRCFKNCECLLRGLPYHSSLVEMVLALPSSSQQAQGIKCSRTPACFAIAFVRC